VDADYEEVKSYFRTLLPTQALWAFGLDGGKAVWLVLFVTNKNNIYLYDFKLTINHFSCK
jgi:hypothetical protein